MRAPCLRCRKGRGARIDGSARLRTRQLESFTTDRRGTVVADDSILGQPRAVGAREAIFRPHPNRCPVGRGWVGATMRDTQADVPSARWLRAQLAFKDSMIRGILQFTPSIAFRYVLHRCESRDIRCRESLCVGPNVKASERLWFSLAHSALGFVRCRGPPTHVEFHAPKGHRLDVLKL